MKDREARITARLDEAAHKRAEAEEEAEQYRARKRELEEQREEMLARAREEAETRREQLIEEARVEAERAQAQWFEALQQEQRDLLQDLRERTSHHVFAIARRLLRDLADADLEEQILDAFLERLPKIDPAEHDAIVAAVGGSDGEVELRTAFPLAPETRERVTRSLREDLGEAVGVRFAVAPELGCGIELRAHSHRLVWNLESYLEGLEEGVFEALEKKAVENGQARQHGTAPAETHPR
jgi:F-type H+-transporting ATPase subunit b